MSHMSQALTEKIEQESRRLELHVLLINHIGKTVLMLPIGFGERLELVLLKRGNLLEMRDQMHDHPGDDSILLDTFESLCEYRDAVSDALRCLMSTPKN